MRHFLSQVCVFLLASYALRALHSASCKQSLLGNIFLFIFNTLGFGNIFLINENTVVKMEETKHSPETSEDQTLTHNHNVFPQSHAHSTQEGDYEIGSLLNFLWGNIKHHTPRDSNESKNVARSFLTRITSCWKSDRQRRVIVPHVVEVDTFIGNHTVVDPEIFQLWIEGNSAQEAATVLQQRGALHAFPGATADFLLADVMDHYRTYGMLEKLLHTPQRISEQWTFQMDFPTQKMLIEQFYDFDDIVMREILGNKLSSRQRKDLDKVSETTGVNLRSCRRQFDNAKRIFKATEEMTGSMHHNIKNSFLLSDDLTKKYCAVVFIAGYRFETNKKKLQYLSFNDFCHCAYAMMTHWTSPIVDENSTADIEREFLVDLRELRVLLDKEREHKTTVCQKLKGKISDKILSEIEHNFKVYSRTLINIAYSLHHNKSLKEVFVDLVEKYIEPCKHLQWTVLEMKIFLEIYSETAAQLDVIKSQQGLRSVWKRYMDGISGCLLAMYHN